VERECATPHACVSAREAEVLAALAEHLTNAEIAARLFVSIRTVESHVSSLLRKFGVPDRRALARVAAGPRSPSTRSTGAGATATGDTATPTRVAAALPQSATSHIGAHAERAQLIEALGRHRLVMAVGPDGIGKTRLALAVAGELAVRFRDGVWYVDLVALRGPSTIAPAIAAALGLSEQHGRPAEDTMLAWLAERETLLVLDNGEHLVDGVAALVERLLVAGSRLVVLGHRPDKHAGAVPGDAPGAQRVAAQRT